MKRKVIAFFAVVTMLMLMAIPSAHAAPGAGRGYELNNSGYDGLRAVMSTGVGTGSPPSFAFTAKSPDVYQHFAQQVHPKNSCVQGEVVHKKFANVAGTSHQLLVTNTCSPSTGSGTFTFDLTNATFRSSYVRTNTYNDTGTSYQDEVVDIRIVQTNTGTNEWSFYIYNASTGVYDWKASISGTVIQPDGYFDIGDGGYTQDSPGGYCPTLYPWGVLEIRGVQKRSGGVWSWITSGDITYTIADSWPCLSVNTYEQKSSLYHQIKMVPYGVAY